MCHEQNFAGEKSNVHLFSVRRLDFESKYQQKEFFQLEGGIKMRSDKDAETSECHLHGF